MGRERYTTDFTRDGGAGGDSGDAESARLSAFESELAARFRERIRMFAARRLGDHVAAEDVAQETLRRVVEALRAARVEDLGALPGFVFQTARNICLQRHRSAIREARALSLWAAHDSAADPDALVALISEERCAAVRRALEELNHDDRALLRALYFESGETGDVAERMGVSAGALRVRKHRALLRLSELLHSREL